MKEKILTLHPQGKSGKNIDREKYDLIKSAILKALSDGKSLTHTQLNNDVKKQLKSRFEGTVEWYLETVKLDLEARKTIKRETLSKPSKYYS